MTLDLGLQILSYAVSIGALYGAINTRLKQLEKKVDLHNNVVKRMYIAEGKINSIEDKINIYHDETMKMLGLEEHHEH